MRTKKKKTKDKKMWKEKHEKSVFFSCINSVFYNRIIISLRMCNSAKRHSLSPSTSML